MVARHVHVRLTRDAVGRHVHLWVDAEFKESEHPRGQPGNAGQFASSPGGSKSSARSSSGSGSRSKRLETARAEVAKLADPKAYYEEQYKRATEAFRQNGISLDKTYGRGNNPDELSLRKWSGEEKVDPASLGKVLGLIWKDLQEANEAAAGAQVSRPATHETMRKIADVVSDYAGWDKSRLTITDDDYKFTLGDRECFAGGTAHLETGEIKLYAKQLDARSVAPVMAHEVMHQKWQAVYNAWSAQRSEALGLAKAAAFYKSGRYQQLLKRYEGEGAPLSDREGEEFAVMHALVEEGRMPAEDPLDAEDKPRGSYAERWPIYAAIGSLDTRPLAEDDGITDYSREWWAEAEKKGGDWTRSAIHETLAEMARLEWEGSLDRLLWYKESKIWKPLYQAVQKFYPEVSKNR